MDTCRERCKSLGFEESKVQIASFFWGQQRVGGARKDGDWEPDLCVRATGACTGHVEGGRVGGMSRSGGPACALSVTSHYSTRG